MDHNSPARAREHNTERGRVRERERERGELAGLTGKRGFHALLKVLDDKPLASREKRVASDPLTRRRIFRRGFWYSLSDEKSFRILIRKALWDKFVMWLVSESSVHFYG